MPAPLEEYMLDLTNLGSVEELWSRHCARMKTYGFDRLIYGFTRFLTETSFGDPNDLIVLSNHSQAYRKGFVEDGLYRHAPMVRWALENDGWCSWQILADQARQGMLTSREEEVLSFNLKHQVSAGYTISFRSVSHRAKGAIALTARDGLTQEDVDALWAQKGTEIVLLNNLVHLKILTLPFPLQGQALTERQRQALEWVGDGKTNQDIAAIMGLTPATVEKHLRLVRERLNVSTTAQAVAKAAFFNQMHVLEDQ